MTPRDTRKQPGCRTDQHRWLAGGSRRFGRFGRAWLRTGECPRMVTIAPRRFASASSADFGREPPGPVMGDPLSVPEAELEAQPAGYRRYEPELSEPLWIRLPPDIAPYIDLGFVHDDVQCPLVVVR